MKTKETKGASHHIWVICIEHARVSHVQAYRTPSGKGHVGGPMVIVVNCLDGIPLPESADGCAMLDSPFKLKRELPRQNETLDIAIPGSTKDGQAARIPLLALSDLDEEGFPCKPEARARESVLRTQQNRSNPVINE